MSGQLNAVEQRLLHLCELWSQFAAQAGKRLLVWQVRESAVRTVHCFFEVQKHETDYTTEDLFVVFDAPFEHTLQYSKAVKHALRAQYEASREDFKQDGLEDDWSFQPGHTPDTAAGVMEALRSFGSKYHRAIGRLVAVFVPVTIVSEQRFTDWLLRALEHRLPERLRLLTLDSLEHPRLQRLTAQDHPEVHVQQPSIDALSLAQETFAREHTIGPAGVFRNLMMGVVTLIEKGSTEAVISKAKDAVAFARAHQWLDQEVVLRIMVAGALLKESRHPEALQVYRGARESAQAVHSAQHPAGSNLVLQTWFGEAGVQLAANDPAEAAVCYEAAAELALETQNAVLAVEAYRMTGVCLARTKDREGALEKLQLALELGPSLKPQARSLTTLPIAAMDLLRTLDPGRVAAMQPVRGHLEERLRQAEEVLEQQALCIEPHESAALEQEHERRIEHAYLLGETELAELVAAAPEPFAAVFHRTRELLGEGWPLEDAAALPAPVKGSAGA